uniref:Uncharacterized protein n=2 Tax=Anguilla anguilla TaxID=7936 RepID=A0A0E9PMW6_ANGAN
MMRTAAMLPVLLQMSGEDPDLSLRVQSLHFSH